MSIQELRNAISAALDFGEPVDDQVIQELCEADPVAECIRLAATRIAVRSLREMIEQRISDVEPIAAPEVTPDGPCELTAWLDQQFGGNTPAA